MEALISIIASDLLTGVLLGVTLSLIRLLLRLGNFTLEVRQSDARVDASLAGAVTFVGLPRLAAQLEALPHPAELHLRVDEVAYIDHACLVAIADFERLRKRAGERVHVPWSELDGRSEKVRGDADVVLASGSGH
ncbi:MAG TPA: hypothetical protein VJV78_09770 [Polyangiales bacterium]|nr:hypothetical protein [Polyangiales bacterium]